MDKRKEAEDKGTTKDNDEETTESVDIQNKAVMGWTELRTPELLIDGLEKTARTSRMPRRVHKRIPTL